MEKIVINTISGKSTVHIGERWTNVFTGFNLGNYVIITDENLKSLYQSSFPGVPVLSVLPGEQSKSMTVVEKLAEVLLKLGIDRKGFLLGIGGGVVSDLTGFVGSIYMRGIRFGFISTSLLSQVDASVGGKNGVNSSGVKNVLGTFTQPEFVVCDPLMLSTLPEDEFLSGLAEIIKTGIILDNSILEIFENEKEKILSRDETVMYELILKSVKHKASVVTEDEKESGKRMILNFGHTFGHAIESSSGLKHGFAVASGMAVAAAVSSEFGLLLPEDKSRIISILKDYKLLKHNVVLSSEILEKIKSDKKKSGDSIRFVLTGPPGNAILKDIPVSWLSDFIIKKGDLL